MRTIAALSIAFGVFAIAQAMSVDDKNAMKQQLANTCQAKEGASDAEMALLHKHEAPTTKEGKCVLACVFETIGMIQNGKLSLEGGLAVVEKMHPGSEKAVEVAKNIHADCDSVSDGDRCEYAFKACSCIKASAAKQGITFDDDM